ncbi:methionine adenosyltransferase [Candidatus Jorgensenbacteria bacterium]|nr:methionine adenosyltransferase [Candidatus Jorgensenbacteria bacterium]
MSRIEYLTSESVTEGHPDKVCDQISDAILDAYLKEDPYSRVAVEALITQNHLTIAGEVTSHAVVNVEEIARNVMRDIGYDGFEKGLDYREAEIAILLHAQSPDIARGVQKKKIEEQGAGDQGMMYGYASNETKEFMPLPIVLAHALARRLAYVRKKGIVPNLYPDGKSQVVVAYRDGRPEYVRSVLISAQHSETMKLTELKRLITKHVILSTILKRFFIPQTKILVNPTGRFVVGGPEGDTGLTGRKIIVDTYGGACAHGGGAFSGKDPSKVDRSASYAMRWVAKNLVAAKLCDRVETRVSYAIGMNKPLSVDVNTYGTGKLPDDKIALIAAKVFDLRPGMIIKNLKLLQPIYAKTAAYGHFGRRDLKLPWETVNKVDQLRKFLKRESKR